MKALIVYDSFFGNTEKIAQAIGKSIHAKVSVEVLRISNVTQEHLMGVEVLIVGSPTRGFRPTKPVVAFLKQIPANGLKGVKVLAFDTRLNPVDVNSRVLNVFVKLFGYAAKPIADLLEKKGGVLALPPEGFFVKESEGPLKDGELERAANWAKVG